MSEFESSTGDRLLAIPHNGNLSNGLMFDDVTLSGAPLTRDYAERRARWEPLYEVTQMKGMVRRIRSSHRTMNLRTLKLGIRDNLALLQRRLTCFRVSTHEKP